MGTVAKAKGLNLCTFVFPIHKALERGIKMDTLLIV